MNQKKINKIIITVFLPCILLILAFICSFSAAMNITKSANALTGPPSILKDSMPKAIVKMSFEDGFKIESETSAKFGSFSGAGGAGYIGLSADSTGSQTKIVDSGKVDRGIQFVRAGSATSDRLTIPNSFSSAGINPCNDSFSVSMWINRTTEDLETGVLGQVGGGETMIWVENTGIIGFMYAGGGDKSSDSLGKGWHHLAMTVYRAPGSSIVKGYLDGRLIVNSQSTSTYNTYNRTTDFEVGQHQNGGRGVDATIDEIYFYDDALTDAQVKYSYYYSGLDGGYTLSSYTAPPAAKNIYIGDPLDLPQNIDVTLRNNDTVRLPVTYDNLDFMSDDVKTVNVTGTIFTGDFKKEISFSDTFTVTVSVIMDTLLSYTKPSDRKVPLGAYHGLPELLTISLDGDREKQFEVDYYFSDGYDPDTAGIYTVTGIINAKNCIIGENFKQTFSVLVEFSGENALLSYKAPGNRYGYLSKPIPLPSVMEVMTFQGPVMCSVSYTGYDLNVAGAQTVTGTVNDDYDIGYDAAVFNPQFSLVITVVNAIASFDIPEDKSVRFENGKFGFGNPNGRGHDLPTTIAATLSNGAVISVDVTYDKELNTESVHSEPITGTIFTGDYVLEDGVESVFSVNITVRDALLTFYKPEDDKSVYYGQDHGYPTSITVYSVLGVPHTFSLSYPQYQRHTLGEQDIRVAINILNAEASANFSASFTMKITIKNRLDHVVLPKNLTNVTELPNKITVAYVDGETKWFYVEYEGFDKNATGVQLVTGKVFVEGYSRIEGFVDTFTIEVTAAQSSTKKGCGKTNNALLYIPLALCVPLIKKRLFI